MLAQKIQQGNCPDCGSGETYYSHTQDGSIYKVYGNCDDCGRDFGRIGTIPMSKVDHPDVVAEKAENIAQNFFG